MMGDDNMGEMTERDWQRLLDDAPPPPPGAVIDDDMPSNVVNLPNMAGGEPAHGLEDAIAVAFTNKYRDQLRFDHDANAWYQWTQTRWLKLKVPVAFQFAREIGRNQAREQKSAFKASTAGGAERFARADPAHRCTADIWDRDPMLLGTPKGTIDLRNAKLRIASPADNITKLTGCDPSSKSPTRWLEFLSDATGGDEETIGYLQRVCGYCLTGLVSEHALFFIYGPGGNGKSVFLNVLKHVLGDYAATAAMETFVSQKYSGHPTELAMLQGARGVFASETEEGRAWAEARIKALTGGDPITARFMRQDFFTFQPQFKLLIVGNHQPALNNVDDAMRRRFHIIPFTRKPERPDPMLEEKLKEEAPQILGWMIRGCIEWQREGLQKPAAVDAATDKYFTEQDVFSQFLDERCRVEADNSYLFTPTQKLFKAWTAFAAEVGARAGDLKSFTPRLEQQRLNRGRVRVGGGNPQSGFYGIQLISEPDWSGGDR